MKRLFYYHSVSFFIIMLFTACLDTSVPQATAAFEIQKDTVIAGVKTRVQVSIADTINPVYFVHKGISTFNTVWPGDKIKSKAAVVTLDTTYVNGKRIIKKKTTVLTYYISQDYDTRDQSIIMSVFPKKDTTITQLAPKYQGVSVPFGSSEISYVFQSKGTLKVTWIARNADYKNDDEAISQKIITVK